MNKEHPENPNDFRNHITLQYDRMGMDYVEGQRGFFSEREDWSRRAIQEHFGEVRDKDILDIGSGGGTDTALFEKAGARGHGIDPSTTMVEAARKAVKHPDRIQLGEYESIPFPDASMDRILGRFSLHYLERFDLAYAEMHRVLRPDGTMLMIVSHPAFDLTYRMEHPEQDMITVSLYGGKATITFPYHELSDYFSPAFFERFELTALAEYTEPDMDRKTTAPGALLYVARKKEQTHEK